MSTNCGDLLENAMKLANERIRAMDEKNGVVPAERYNPYAVDMPLSEAVKLADSAIKKIESAFTHSVSEAVTTEELSAMRIVQVFALKHRDLVHCDECDKSICMEGGQRLCKELEDREVLRKRVKDNNYCSWGKPIKVHKEGK